MLRFVLFSLLLPFTGLAQETVMKGYLGVMSTGETFTYELHFTESIGGNLNGYALTYTKPGLDARAPVTGKINRAAKTLSFSEESIDYNHGFDSRAVICLVSATLSFRPEATNGRMALAGPISSNDASNAACAKGSLSFTADTGITAFFARPDIVPPSSAPSAPKPVVQAAVSPAPVPALSKKPAVQPAAKAPAPKPPLVAATGGPKTLPPAQQGVNPAAQKVIARGPAAVKPAPPAQKAVVIPYEPPTPKQMPTESGGPGQEITEGTDLVLDWQSDSVVVEIWDGNKVDGDAVTVQYNARTLLSRYTLRAVHRRVAIPTSDSGGVLRIIADYEGTEAPNTATVILHDGSTEHPLVANNTVGKMAIIRIRKRAKS